MTRWGMVIDLERCTGCQTCTMTCKVENSLPPDIFWARVLKREVGKYPVAKRVNLPMLCMHCREPACVDVCPTGASQQRPDGIVFVDSAKCIGCRYCMMACPYEVRSFFSGRETYFAAPTPYEEVTRGVLGKRIPKGTVSKCDLCKDRVDAGNVPACVETCLGKARVFGDLDDPGSRPAELLRTRRYFQLQLGAGTRPCVYYLMPIEPDAVSRSANVVAGEAVMSRDVIVPSEAMGR